MKLPIPAGLSMAGAILLSANSLSITVAVAAAPITIVITESRSAETVDETLVPVSIITRQDIERQQVTSVADVLKTVPGISLSNTGGIGKLTSVFLRGTESDHVLVLIDGVKVGSATLGTTPFHDLPIDQIERIEVVRGPRSSLYGSAAIGGIIQIFTKKGTGKIQPEFSMGAGSHGLARLNTGVSGGSEHGWYRLGVSTLSTKGINDCRGSSSAGCYENEPDPDGDGYENQAISLRGGFNPGPGIQIAGNVFTSENATEFDGSFANYSETQTSLASLKASFKIKPRWNSTLILAESEDKSDNFLNSVPKSRFNTARTQITFQNDFLTSGNGLIIAGIDYLDDAVRSTTKYAVSSRHNYGLFVSSQTRIKSNSYEVSVRRDDNQQFGGQTTGGIGWGRNLGDGKRVTASLGTAFKAPSFNDLYWPDSGNPKLAPETSRSLDIGFANLGENGQWAVNLYQTEIREMITWDTDTYSSVNMGRAKISGMELSGDTVLGKWNVGFSLTLQKPKDDSAGPDQGKTLPRRARVLAQVDVNRDLGRYSLGGSVYRRGSSFDNLQNTTKLDGFTRVDLHGEFDINPNWVAGLSIKNILDEEYETAAFYNQDGANFLATLRYTPN